MAVPKAQCSLVYCGHSAVIITTETGKRVAIDPWLDGNPKCPEHLKDPGKLDIIILTHGHSDHASSTVALAREYGSTICATYELAVLLGKDGVPEKQLQFMNKGGTVTLGELSISLTNAFHSSSYDAADGKTYYAGEACGAVLTLESKRNIYHAGDTCLFNDMSLIRKKFKPELAFLPIGDRFTMNPREAARAASFVGCKFAVPVHFDTFDLLTGTPEEFVDALKPTGTQPVVLKPGGEFRF